MTEVNKKLETHASVELNLFWKRSSGAISQSREDLPDLQISAYDLVYSSPVSRRCNAPTYEVL